MAVCPGWGRGFRCLRPSLLGLLPTLVLLIAATVVGKCRSCPKPSLIPPPAPGQNALGWEAGAGKDRADFLTLACMNCMVWVWSWPQAGQGMFPGSPQASCSGWDFEGSYVPTLKTYFPLSLFTL